MAGFREKIRTIQQNQMRVAERVGFEPTDEYLL
jgi:hypothetical protein